MKCSICEVTKEVDLCEVVELTPQDKKALLDNGHEDVPDKLYYCKPCWRLLQDPVRAAQYMRNNYEQQLRQMGIPGAKLKADQYYTKLIEMQRRNKHGTQA